LVLVVVESLVLLLVRVAVLVVRQVLLEHLLLTQLEATAVRQVEVLMVLRV
jgi:hypothetical protein